MPHIAVYIYQPLKWQATFVLPLWGVFGGISLRIVIFLFDGNCSYSIVLRQKRKRI